MRLDNPAASAQQWATKLGGARQQYVDGINSVTVPPGQLAAAAADRWANNTVAAKPKFARNVASVQIGDWKNSATTKGADRLASGAQASLPKMESAFVKLFPAIKQAVQSLPPRGDLEANITRSAEFARKMAQYQK